MIDQQNFGSCQRRERHQGYLSKYKQISPYHYRKTVNDFVKNNPDKGYLLDEPSSNDASVKTIEDGNYLLSVKTKAGLQQNVVTMGKKFKYSAVASAIKNFPTSENQLEIYKSIYENLPDDEKQSATSNSLSNNIVLALQLF